MDAAELRNAANSPAKLESLYRGNPDTFAALFPDVFKENPDSMILQTWRERLSYEASITPAKSTSAPTASMSTPTLMPAPVTTAADKEDKHLAILVAIYVSLLAGTLLELPQMFPAINEEFFYPRNVPFVVLISLASYFLVTRGRSKKEAAIVIAPAVLGLIFINLLPQKSSSDTVVLSMLFLPFVWWSLLGLAYVGGLRHKAQDRMAYLRDNGEVIIYSTVILIGGMVLTAVTLGLFNVIKLEIEEWYFKYIAVYGAAASPVVGALIVDKLVGRRVKIAPLVARIFTPLFLVMVVVFLVAMLVQQNNPYNDRDFCIAFNALLLVVLALSILAIAERDPGATVGFSDVMTLGLVAVTLVVDVIALSAILFRLSDEFGLTPNRIAVLGTNIVALGHLAGIVYFYTGAFRAKSSMQQVERWIGRYIPVYTGWAIIVGIGFPLIFWFK